MYLPETNVMLTRFLSPAGVGEIVDFMPVQDRSRKERHEIVRIVHGVRGQVAFRATCLPSFDYARAAHELEIRNNCAVFSSVGRRLGLACPFELRNEGGAAVADFVLGPNQSATFVLYLDADGRHAPEEVQTFGQEALVETIALWKRWVAKCRYQCRWRETVIRSA